MPRPSFAALGALALLAWATQALATPSHQEVLAALRDPVNSTGNIADAVEEATGARGWMSADMKPVIDTKIVGRAATALMRPVLRTDGRKYTNHLLEILDQAEPGSVLVYVMQDGLEIAAMGNLMATTAKVRGIEGVVIDGAVRDITEIRQIGLPVWSRRVSPATSVGRMVSVDKQIPVQCGGVMVRPGDYIEFLAEIELLGALSACPGGDCSSEHSSDAAACHPLLVQVFRPVAPPPGWAPFPANGYDRSHGQMAGGG